MFLTFCFYSSLRVAVDFLDSRSFCKNSHHMKGESLMKKRHLEILGYRVVQVRWHHWRLHCTSLPLIWFKSQQHSDRQWITCVLQIPHFEWNSMELSTPDAWKEYLKKNIFRELSSWRPYLLNSEVMLHSVLWHSCEISLSIFRLNDWTELRKQFVNIHQVLFIFSHWALSWHESTSFMLSETIYYGFLY